MKMKFKIVLSLIAITNVVCFSQMRQIKIVDSKSGEPLTGAAVLCDNSGNVTDIDGYVQIDISKCKVLTISYLGYKTYSLNAGDLTDIIQLTSTNNE